MLPAFCDKSFFMRIDALCDVSSSTDTCDIKSLITGLLAKGSQSKPIVFSSLCLLPFSQRACKRACTVGATCGTRTGA